MDATGQAEATLRAAALDGPRPVRPEPVLDRLEVGPEATPGAVDRPGGSSDSSDLTDDSTTSAGGAADTSAEEVPAQGEAPSDPGAVLAADPPSDQEATVAGEATAAGAGLPDEETTTGAADPPATEASGGSIDPDRDSETEPEGDPVDGSEHDPEVDSECGPENVPEDDPETAPENGPENGPVPGEPRVQDVAPEPVPVAIPASTAELSPLPGTDLRADTDRDLRQAARRLRNQIAALPLSLDIPKAPAARRERELLLAQFDDYLLPRLARMDAPLLAVIGGSTGAGKSTLTNSLARKVVSRSGVLRPTTRSPVLVHHPYDSGAFLTQRILPDLARITSEALEPLQPVELDAPRITALRLVPHEGLAPGLALLDAPDIDSVVEANRELAVQLLGAADLWLFVTTAARYGDALPWQMLRTAVERGVSAAVVLDRVPPESLQEVRSHLARMLRDRGLGSSPMFVIPETPLNDGLLPWNYVEPLHRWLMRLAKDSRARDVVVRRTLNGIMDSLPQRGRLLVAAASDQEVAAHVLGIELDAVFATTRSSMTRRLADGTVLRGEALARWRELVGNGELVRYLERATGRFADRMVATIRKTPQLPTEPLARALASAVAAIVDASLHAGVDQALARWQELPGGAGLVAQIPSGTGGSSAVGSSSAVGGSSVAGGSSVTGGATSGRVDELVQQWQARILDAVRGIPAPARMSGRAFALRPESVTALVTFVSFADARADGTSLSRNGSDVAGTAELPTVEIADGASLARRLLDALYGEPVIQRIVDTARENLRSRVEELLNGERAALKALLDEAKVRPGQSEALLDAVKVVEDAR